MCKQLISIIILSYNNINYYKECLDSILMQNYEEIEIIFSDDGSNNFNPIEIEEYINNNKRSNISNVIVNYNKSNLGTVKHSNKTIQMSNGKYIMLLAVDDALYEENTISKVIDYLKKSRGKICVGYVEEYDKNMKRVIGKKPSMKEVEIIKRLDYKEIHKMICISGGFLPAPSRLYDREFFERYGLHDEDYVLLEDKPTIAKAIRKGCKIYFIDEIISKYRDGGISSAGNINQDLKKDREIFNEKEVFPYWGVSFKGENKEYVIWGTSTKYSDNKVKLINKGFKYFVDSDKNKQGKELDCKTIYHPDKLLDENRENLIVVVCSAFYTEIANWLEDNGFKENKNYININFVKEL